MSRAAFRISRPFNVSFSGGRTSAFMLWHILDAYDGKLPSDAPVLFANTGRERNETLDFVHECQRRWNVPVRWLEFTGLDRKFSPDGKVILDVKYREVTYETAHRIDQPNSPFEMLIHEMSVLPNVVARYCTKLLKIRVMRAFLQKEFGWDNDFLRRTAVGIRSDEAHRVMQVQADCPKFIQPVFPMVERSMTESEVMKFWKRQIFDLQLKQYEGNCDLCFLKSAPKLIDIIRHNPSSVDWWMRMETVKPADTNAGAKFHISRTYAGLDWLARSGELFQIQPGEEEPCGCATGVGDWDDAEEVA